MNSRLHALLVAAFITMPLLVAAFIMMPLLSLRDCVAMCAIALQCIATHMCVWKFAQCMWCM
jgi:hypothetical protein